MIESWASNTDLSIKYVEFHLVGTSCFNVLTGGKSVSYDAFLLSSIPFFNWSERKLLCLKVPTRFLHFFTISRTRTTELFLSRIHFVTQFIVCVIHLNLSKNKVSSTARFIIEAPSMVAFMILVSNFQSCKFLVISFDKYTLVCLSGVNFNS